MSTRATAIVQNALDSCSIATPGRHSPGETGPIPFSMSFEDIGFDSLAFMEFCISVHLDTGIEMTTEQLIAFGSPEAVAAYIEERL